MRGRTGGLKRSFWVVGEDVEVGIRSWDVCLIRFQREIGVERGGLDMGL